MFFAPFSPPPLPRNEHEARVVGVIFFVVWGLGLVLLYWLSSRAEKNPQDGNASSPKSTMKPEGTTK
ncbi:MAG: hypothetical protein DMG65_05660 [Candidatus Angelobacter sp. Gp1-AA117]|nr:MAG: hypothetical protein DMG65_05660 [Candidatus Angelobacter sp. Gp1-AA117]